MPIRRQSPKPYFRAALQSDGTLELAIYEEIGFDWWTGQGITAKTIKQQLDQAGSYSQVRVRINSPGGDAFEGIAIYSLLRAQKKPVEVCVDGIAASAASIIAMAGDVINMGPNTMMMIHNASAMCVGYAADMRSMADSLDKISESIAQTYVTRTKKSLAEVQPLMDAETWMTAQECVENGFATAIASEPDGRVEQNALALAKHFKALARLKAVPDRFKAAACSCDCQNCLNGACSDCTNAECEDENCLDCPMQSGADNSVPVPTSQPPATSQPVAEVPGFETAKARQRLRDRGR